MLRVRFAPSPTGYLHIGSARTFIFNWLYARHNGGTVILRIDDTDVERNTQASLDSIFDGLNWLDLGWDEFYRQSDRLELHGRLANEILAKGMAYRDFTPRGSGRRAHSQRVGLGCSMPGCASFRKKRAIDARPRVSRSWCVFACLARAAQRSRSRIWFMARKPRPQRISRTSRCCAATACPRIIWPPARTMPICASAI